MDNTAQSGSSPVGQMGRQMTPPSQRPMSQVQPAPSQDAAATNQGQQPSPQPPQEQLQEEEEQQPQPIVAGGHPEQGPVAVVENDEDDEEEKQVAPQEIKVQSSHQKEVVLSKEVKEAGVEQTDTRKRELEQQMEEANVILGNEVTATPTTHVAQPLPMSYEEAIQAQQTNEQAKSPQNAFAWFITEIIRMWKQNSTAKPEQ